MSELERIIQWEPAFDKRHSDPKKNYGIGGVMIRFLVKGPKGATQFLLSTGWMLLHVQKECDKRILNPEYPHSLCHPLPADVGYHSPTPRYEGQPVMDCDLIAGGKCYYDGSGLRAYDVYNRLLEQGDKGVWEALESEYRCLFEHGKHQKECLCASSDVGMNR